MPRNPLWDELPRIGPHPGYLGGLVVDQPVLIRTPDLVAFVTNIRSYPTGIVFTAVVEGSSEGSIDGIPEVTVEFSDGARWQREDSDRVGEGLRELGGRSSDGPGGASWCAEYWLPSFPPAGPVTFRIQGAGASGDAVIEGQSLREAAKRATDLWA